MSMFELVCAAWHIYIYIYIYSEAIVFLTEASRRVRNVYHLASVVSTQSVCVCAVNSI